MASSLGHITKEDIDKYLKIKLLVCGQSGSGKSSLINSIIGCQVCEVRNPGNADWVPEKAFSRTTTDIKANTAHINGTIVEIWDSPGLQDDSDDKFLRSMCEKCKDVDLLFYCIDCSTVRWIEHEKTLKFMVGNFENTIWKKCILVLTKANMVYVPAQERSHKRRFHERVHRRFLLQFRKQLVNEGLPRDIVDSIPSVSAGIIEGEDYVESQRWLHYVSEKIVTTEPSDFLAELWLTCLETLDDLGKAKFLNITNENRVHNYDDGEQGLCTEAEDKKRLEIHGKINEIHAKVNEIDDKVKEMYDKAVEPQKLSNISLIFTEEQKKRINGVIGEKTIAACEEVGKWLGAIVGLGLGSVVPILGSAIGAVCGKVVGASAGKGIGKLAKKLNDKIEFSLLTHYVKKYKKIKET